MFAQGLPLLFIIGTHQLLLRCIAFGPLQLAAGEFALQVRHPPDNIVRWCLHYEFYLLQVACSDNRRSYAFAPERYHHILGFIYVMEKPHGNSVIPFAIVLNVRKIG